MRWQEALFWVFIWTTQFLPCLCFWEETKIGHKVNGTVVMIDFTPPADNFTKYQVELCPLLEASGNLTEEQRHCDVSISDPQQSFNVASEWPVVRKEIKNVGKAGYYCVLVKPLRVKDGGSCQNGCQPLTSDAFFLRGNQNSDAYDCQKWSVKINLNLKSSERRAEVVYDMKTFKCVHSFRIDLWYMYNASGDCNGIDGSFLKSIVSHRPRGMVVFYSLEPANYCIRIKPINMTSCHGECLPQYSSIKTLYPMLSDGVPEVALPAVQSEQSSAIWLYPTILGALLLGLTALVFAISMRRWSKTRVGNHVELHVVINEENKKPNGDSTKDKSAEEVVVLYSHDSDHQEEGARLLVDFLVDCCGRSVCTAMGDLHLIGIGPQAWVAQKLSTGKVVIVESEGAVARQHSIFNRQCSSDGLLDKVFDNSLSFLWSRNSLIDYGRLFVVRFTRPSNGTLELVVPGLRFTLPEHLPDLYAGLVEAGSVLDIREELLLKWRSQSSYIHLCNFCSRS